MGTEEDWGNNSIHDNGNGGLIYDLYNNSACDITAVGNDWGTINESEVEDHIFHQFDNESLGLVTFIPFIGYNDIEESALEPQVFNPAEATVYTISGQRVNAKALKPGVYIAIMKQGKQTIAKKIIIQ